MEGGAHAAPSGGQLVQACHPVEKGKVCICFQKCFICGEEFHPEALPPSAHFLEALPILTLEQESRLKRLVWTPCCKQALCHECHAKVDHCPFCRNPWNLMACENAEEEGVVWASLSAATLALANTVDSVHSGLSDLASSVLHLPELMVGVGCKMGHAVGGSAVASHCLSASVLPGIAGAVAVVGVGAVRLAAQRSDDQVRRLRSVVRQRGLQLSHCRANEGVAETLCRVLKSHLTTVGRTCPWPGLGGEPGTDWRTTLLASGGLSPDGLQAMPLREEVATSHCTGPGSTRSPTEVPCNHWADLLFLFLLWLDFRPQGCGVGLCETYGAPPLHVCGHDVWREDMRHVAAALARHWHHRHSLDNSHLMDCAVPWRAFVLLVSLDHLLSWDGASTTLMPSAGSSCQSFQATLLDLFEVAVEQDSGQVLGGASTPRAAQAGPQGQAAEACSHFERGFAEMVARPLPQTFCGLWGHGRGLPVGRPNLGREDTESE